MGQVITDREWEIYVDYGYVDEEILNIIALRIKLNYDLTDREKDIYDYYASIIEEILEEM